MGFLHTGSSERAADREAAKSNELINAQIEQNKAQMEEKKHSLYQTRLEILKGQSAQSWEPPTLGKK